MRIGRRGAGFVALVTLAAACGGGGSGDEERSAADLVSELTPEFFGAIDSLNDGDAALATNVERGLADYRRAVVALGKMADQLDDQRDLFPATDARTIRSTAQDLRGTRGPYTEYEDCVMRSGRSACAVEQEAFVEAARSAGLVFGRMVTDYGSAKTQQDAQDFLDGSGGAEVATVQQVASVVAGSRLSVEESLLDYERDEPQITLGRCDPLCQLRTSTLVTVAQTMRVRLDAIDNDAPQNQLFIGAIPRELEGIVEDTLDALTRTITAGEEYRACVTADPTQSTCRIIDLTVATGRLESQLAAWDAYL